MPSTEQQLIHTLGRHLANRAVLNDDAFVDPAGRIYTTDMLIEGQHFDLAYMSPEQLGWKLGAVNLSDIAAMGGSPLYVLVSLGLPKQWTPDRQVTFVDKLYTGLAEVLACYGGEIIGGDTVGAQQVTLNLTAIGQMPEGHTSGRRGDARAGDWIITTGHSGLSAVGLRVLQAQGLDSVKEYPAACEAHCRPRPQLAAGQLLSAAYPRYALMDTSDGLADAALKIASVSKQAGHAIQLRLNAEQIPLHEELRRFACQSGEPPLPLALYGGEDFQLLACVPAPETEQQVQALVTADFMQIGRVVGSSKEEEDSELAVLENTAGELLEALVATRSFQHF